MEKLFTSGRIRELRESGGTVLPLLDTDEALTLLRTLAKPGVLKEPPTCLRESAGNGKGGAYHQIAKPPMALQALADVVGTALRDKGIEVMRNGKHLLLRYGEGAVNFAHQDKGDGRCAYQCVLMLSKPGEDFRGGATYVIDSASGVATELECAEVGNLIVFRARSEDEGYLPNLPARHFYHGMRVVERGSSDVCSRVALGLFQP